MARALCPACRSSLDLDRHIEEGEYFSCPTCKADLELISLHPFVLDWVGDGFETVGLTGHWPVSAKRSKWDKKSRTKARISREREFGYVD